MGVGSGCPLSGNKNGWETCRIGIRHVDRQGIYWLLWSLVKVYVYSSKPKCILSVNMVWAKRIPKYHKLLYLINIFLIFICILSPNPPLSPHSLISFLSHLPYTFFSTSSTLFIEEKTPAAIKTIRLCFHPNRRREVRRLSVRVSTSS